MSQNGARSINSVRQAWVTVTSTKEALSRRSAQTWHSLPQMATQLDPVGGSDVERSLSQHAGLHENGELFQGADHILLLLNIWTVLERLLISALAGPTDLFLLVCVKASMLT